MQSNDVIKLTLDMLLKLIRVYTASNRHYHDLGHIWGSLEELRLIAPVVSDEVAMQFAIWFHDFSNNTNNREPFHNEKVSAEAAVAAIGKLGYPQEFITKVSNLIMVTTHSDEYLPVTIDEKFMCDIDLAPLAADPTRFRLNTRRVRLEYEDVPYFTFVAGRKNIFRKMLEKPFIYHTSYFRQRCEEKARENLETFIKRRWWFGL